MNQNNQYFFLDQFDPQHIKKSKQHSQDIAKYYWDHYCYFADQRSLIFGKLKNALAHNCKSFEFSAWCRIVDSQILGQIANAAEIQAILYPSKMSLSKRCLAIFPKNFEESTSFIQLEEPISPKVKHTRLNAVSYENFF